MSKAARLYMYVYVYIYIFSTSTQELHAAASIFACVYIYIYMYNMYILYIYIYICQLILLVKWCFAFEVWIWIPDTTWVPFVFGNLGIPNHRPRLLVNHECWLYSFKTWYHEYLLVISPWYHHITMRSIQKPRCFFPKKTVKLTLKCRSWRSIPGFQVMCTSASTKAIGGIVWNMIFHSTVIIYYIYGKYLEYVEYII